MLRDAPLDWHAYSWRGLTCDWIAGAVVAMATAAISELADGNQPAWILGPAKRTGFARLCQAL